MLDGIPLLQVGTLDSDSQADEQEDQWQGNIEAPEEELKMVRPEVQVPCVIHCNLSAEQFFILRRFCVSIKSLACGQAKLVRVSLLFSASATPYFGTGKGLCASRCAVCKVA